MHVENDLHEDVELQSELRHALDASNDELEKYWNALLIYCKVAFVEVGESRIFKSAHVSEGFTIYI